MWEAQANLRAAMHIAAEIPYSRRISTLRGVYEFTSAMYLAGIRMLSTGRTEIKDLFWYTEIKDPLKITDGSWRSILKKWGLGPPRGST